MERKDRERSATRVLICSFVTSLMITTIIVVVIISVTKNQLPLINNVTTQTLEISSNNPQPTNALTTQSTELSTTSTNSLTSTYHQTTFLPSTTSVIGTTCSDQPCQNNGTCQESNTTGFNCLCTIDYKGSYCEERYFWFTVEHVNMVYPSILQSFDITSDECVKCYQNNSCIHGFTFVLIPPDSSCYFQNWKNIFDMLFVYVYNNRLFGNEIFWKIRSDVSTGKIDDAITMVDNEFRNGTAWIVFNNFAINFVAVIHYSYQLRYDNISQCQRECSDNVTTTCFMGFFWLKNEPSSSNCLFWSNKYIAVLSGNPNADYYRLYTKISMDSHSIYYKKPLDIGCWNEFQNQSFINFPVHSDVMLTLDECKNFAMNYNQYNSVSYKKNATNEPNCFVTTTETTVNDSDYDSYTKIDC